MGTGSGAGKGLGMGCSVAMLLGVTIEAVGLNMIFSSILFILGGSLLFGLIAIPIHLACRLACGKRRPWPQRVYSPTPVRRTTAIRAAASEIGRAHV